MELSEKLKSIIYEAFIKNGYNIDKSVVEISPSKDKTHGDFASNVCMKCARLLGTNPIELGKKIISSVNDDSIEKIELAGPGFMNFYIKSGTLSEIIPTIIDQGSNYGNGENKNITINLEYVSANPTGDLHLGHARGAAIGDSLSRILKKAGYKVIREFYVNDAGVQMLNLAKSLKSRYYQLFKVEYPMPEDGYFGKDVKDIARAFKKEFKDKYLNTDDSNLPIFRQYGMDKEMAKLQADLLEFRVEFDVYSFETNIRANNAVENLVKKMDNYIYQDEGATYLKTSEFLDDKDRVIIKSNGDYTYFLPDIVYHLDKYSRNANYLVDVLGADHHGYINRMKSALMMNGLPEDALSVELIQMVRLLKDGVEVKMSKRKGNAIKMRDLVNLVGVDSCRYFFASRAASSHLDFDLDVAMSQSSTNPVFYAQYAYARLYNVINQSKIQSNDKYELLVEEAECSLMKVLAEYDKVVQDAASERAPYKICTYVQKLAGFVHEFYTKCRILDEKNIELTGARLSLCKACSIVLKDALSLVGVNAPEKM